MRKLFILLLLAFSLTSCSLKLFEITKEEKYEYNLDTDSLHKNGPLVTHAMPSIGNVKCLVIPINFESRNKLYSVDKNIENVFNGKSDTIKYESVSSYYEKSSNKLLNLEFTILDWYTPNYNSSYYESYSKKQDSGVDLLVDEALSYYDDKIDYSSFDSDSDGYIDGLWLLYNKEAQRESDFWWAYTSLSDGTKEFDGKKTFGVSFASTSFMNNEASYYVDASTYIHETGHLLGLDDYYSYNPTTSGGLYGADMMDGNLGDHSSLSKILLGWVKPTIVEKSGDYTLNPFSKEDGSGNVLLVSNHQISTIYDEYILIDYFTPEGLNKNQGLFLTKLNQSTSGIRVYYANATINFDSNGYPTMTDDTYYQSGFKYNNSNQFRKMLKLLGANVDETIYGLGSNRLANADFLYTEKNLELGVDVWSDLTYADSSRLNFTMKVNSLGDVANITINLEG